MRPAGFVAIGLGALLWALGLLFIVGSGGEARRFVVAAVALATGAVLFGVGGWLLRRGAARSPEALMARILAVAGRRNGEVSEVEVFAALGRDADRGPAVLQRVVRLGLAERRAAEGAHYYLFRGLQPRLFTRRCAYCAAEVSLASDAEACPRCGGALQLDVEARSLSEGVYAMDE